MLNKIIAYSIKNKLIIGMFVIALVGWGVFEVTRLPIDAVPDITDNQVQVITVSPSLGANDIERLVTFPIEQACSSIPGTKQIRSFSRFGLSLITIVFNDGIDIYWASFGAIKPFPFLTMTCIQFPKSIFFFNKYIYNTPTNPPTLNV